MTQSVNSELIEAFSGVISNHRQRQTRRRRSGLKTEKWIESRLAHLDPKDQDVALIQWIDHSLLLRASDTPSELTTLIESLSRFGRAYARAREKLRLGETREDAEGCFERVNEARRIASSEWIGFVPLHRNGRLGELSIVAEGGRTRVSLDFQDLFQALLSLRPEGFYLIHNHPSGDLVPSREDRILTFEVQNIAHDLRMKFLGHGIVSSRGNHWIVV